MRLRSTVKKILYLLIFFVFCALVTNLVIGLFKQIIAQKRINFHLEEKRAQLKQLKEENQELQAKLSEVEDPDFLEKEAVRLFGLTSEENIKNKDLLERPPEAKDQLLISNWKKWLERFGF